jgi:hypothetical protein
MATMIFTGCTASQKDASTAEPVLDNQVELEKHTNGFGAVGAKADGAYTLEEMLTYAIQDEYLARAEYEKLIEEFDVDRPFTNIIKAEETHIELLKPLFEAYDIPIPSDTSNDHLVIPSELEAVYEIGVQAEIDNIAMYESFLSEDLPDDVRSAFESLMAASESHLNAFQKNLARFQ